MNDQTVFSRAKARLAKIEDAHYHLDQEASEIETFLRVFERLVGGQPETAFQESPPEKTLPAKTSSAEREGGDSSATLQETEAPKPLPESTIATPAEAKTFEREPLSNGSGEAQDEERSASPPIQESVPDTHQGQTEVVTPSSDESARPGGGSDALPATHSQQAAVDADIEIDEQIELGASEAGRFDSGSLTEIVVKEEVRVLSAGESRGMQWPSGVGRSDSEESLAAGEATVSPAPIPPGKSGEAAPSASPALLTDKVAFIHEHEPDWTARQIADSIGVAAKQVDAAAKRLGIKLRRLSPEELSEARRRGGALGGAAVSNAAKHRGPSPTAQKVIDANKAHPEWTATELANAVGTYQQNIYAIAKAHGLTVTRVVQRRAKSDPTKFVRSDLPATKEEAASSAPTPGPIAESPPAPIPEQRAPAFEAGDPDEDYIHPSLTRYPAKPTGNKVSLKDQVSGFYLHDSVTALSDGTMMLTMDVDRAWRGTREQLKAVRIKFPKTAGLTLVAVPVRRKA